MKIIIAVPTHNESLVIEASLRELISFCERKLPAHDWRIVVADNGSRDDTIARVARIGDPRLAWFHLASSGKGAAIKKAWTDYKGDRYVFMDADLATDLDALPRLLELLQTYDLVIGSRLVPGSVVERSIKRKIISLASSWFTRAMLPIGVRDIRCGFKGIRAEAWTQLLPMMRHPGFFFDTELVMLALVRGMRIKEIPISWREQRTAGRTSKVRVWETLWDDVRSVMVLRKRLRT